MAKIAFLGTGLIGGGLAEGAAGRGDEVTVWNRTPAKAEALREHGVTVASSPAEAVRGAARVHLALSDDDAVEAVLTQALQSAGDAVIIDHTTASPDGTADRAAQLEGRGVAFLHAPVFMSPQMCREAKGMMIVAGPRDVFERVEPGLAAMTGKVRYLGSRRDLAAAHKLFGNAMIVAITAGFADVLAMAVELDIDPIEAHGLFDDFNPAGVLAYRGKNMAEGRYDPSFELTMARKDVRLMLEAAADRTLASLPAIAERMDTLIEAGHGGDDLGILSVDAVPKRAVPKRDAVPKRTDGPGER